MANANEGEIAAGAVTDEKSLSVLVETTLAFELIADPVVSVLMAAAASFQDLETGRAWLSTANAALKNKAPLALLETQQGRSIVLNELGLIEHGMF